MINLRKIIVTAIISVTLFCSLSLIIPDNVTGDKTQLKMVTLEELANMPNIEAKEINGAYYIIENN